MGSSQSKKETIDILNDTKVKTAIKNLNESINKMTMDVIQKQLVSSAASATVKQEIEISGIRTAGDFKVSDIDQSSKIEIGISTLTNSELKADLVTKTMNELQTKMAENMKLSQSQAQKQGEKIISELVGALSGAIASVTGGKIDSQKDVNLQNLLNIDSETELKNKIEQSINTELVNETINEISNNLIGAQDFKIEDIEAGGDFVVTNISQEFLSNQMLESIALVGTGSEIISSLGSVNKSDIDKVIKTDVEQTTKEEGTIESAGNAVSNILGGFSNLFAVGFLPLLIIGGIVIMFVVFFLRGSIGATMEKRYGQPQQKTQKQPTQQTQQTQNITPAQMAQLAALSKTQKGGKMKSKLYMYITKKVMKLINIIKKPSLKLLKNIKKNITRNNLLILLLIISIVLLSMYIYNTVRYNRIEGFTNESKLDDLKIEINSKYISNVKLGSQKLCLVDDIKKAFKFDIIIINKKDIYIVKMQNKDKLYFKTNINDVVIDKYDFIYDKLYKFSFEKKENKYILKQNNKYIGLKDECLVLVDKKEDAIEMEFK